MTAIEHQYDSGDPIISARRGLTGRMQFDGTAQQFLHLGDYVAGGSPSDAFDPTVRYPIILPSELEQHHLLILGATRSGKSSRALLPIAEQKILQQVGPVIVIDMKGDNVMFQRLRTVAELTGRQFKYLTNVPYFSTFLFNPWDQEPLLNVTLPQFVQINMIALNLWHGFGYGRGFYSAQTRSSFMESLRFERNPRLVRGRRQWQPTAETERITSFQDAYERVHAMRNHPEYGGASQLLMILRDLANLTPLNFEREGRPLPQTAIDESIRVSDLLRRDENSRYPVLYLYLRATTELVGVSQIAKLLLYCLYEGLVQARDFYRLGRREEEPPAEVWVGMDEIQHIADDALRTMLEQASGAGMHFALANQNLSQLKQQGDDLIETVWENCGAKLLFTARDVDLQDRLIKISGEKTIHAASYQISHDAYRAGKVDERYAIQIANGAFQGIEISQQRGPRFDRNLLIEMSNHPSRCLYVPPEGATGVDFGGYPIILDCPYQITKQEYDALDAMPWPEPTPGTIVPEEFDQSRRSSNQATNPVSPPDVKRRVVE